LAGHSSLVKVPCVDPAVEAMALTSKEQNFSSIEESINGRRRQDRFCEDLAPMQ
jgi:hypothetical protein